MKVGVFDSGIGGLSVANAISAEMPDIEIVLRDDKAHLPYGTKKPKEILEFVIPIFQDMVNQECVAIVVACNTVTTTLIPDLRSIFGIPLVAVEPMVKPAALATKSKTIAVCATPTTLNSFRYKELKKLYAQGIEVLQPDCSDWANLIESGDINKSIIEDRITEVLDKNADVIVLGCTHYHWIEEEINNLANGKAIVLQPEKPLLNQLKKVLARLK
jgi:glutamate racemase